MWTCFPIIFCDVSLVSCIFLTVAELCNLEYSDSTEEQKQEEVISLLILKHA